jgi:macrolide transport system ATP-binding/permease protein
MGTLLQDLRYSLRMLRQRPGFTFVAIVTLALGIGVNTALFTVFEAFALKPLPLKNPESIVRLSGRNRDGATQPLFSYAEYLDYRDRNHAMAGLAAWNKVAVTLGPRPSGANDDLAALSGDDEYIFGQLVSGNYFELLDAEMTMGRAFLPEEDRTPDARPVVVLSYSFWQRRFDSDPDILGKTIPLDGQPFTVVGVVGRDFIGTEADAPQFWMPLMMRDQVIGEGGWNYKRWLTDRDADSFALVGRLRPGVSRQQAEAEMSGIAEQLAAASPERQRKRGIRLSRAATFIEISAELMPLVVPLLVAVGLVLLIACANVANLLLARAAARQKEIAVRLALGASRGRIVRQLLTESVVLAVLGGAVALLLTTWALAALYPVVMTQLPIPRHLAESFALNLEPDLRVFGFALLASVVAGVAAGLAPALQASRPNLSAALKDEGSTFGAHLRQSRLRNGLVVLQLAVCLSLLAGAGLLVRNLQKVGTIDTGLETANLFAVTATLQTPQPDPRREADLRRQLATRLRHLPGVESLAQVERQPLTGMPPTVAVALPGQAQDDERALRAGFNMVSPEYFATVGLRLTRGRGFSEQEAQAGAPVAVITEATAHRLWPNGEAIGQRIGLNLSALTSTDHHEPSPESFPQFEVIGVTRDTRSGWVWRKDESFIYVPLGGALRESGRAGQTLLVRAASDPQRVMQAARAEAETLDPNLRVRLRRVDDSLTFQMAPFRALALLAGAVGLLALLLASIGLYGVMSFVVNQRRREIGIRVALGAPPALVVRMFVLQGLRLAAAGTALGIAGGLGISRLLAAVLIDVSPFDPLAFCAVAIFLIGVALLAVLIPARRAARVDPMIALRYE